MVPFCLVNDYFFHCRSRLVYSSVASLTRKMYAMASSDAKFVIFVMLHYCGVCMLICEFMVIEPETFEMNKKKSPVCAQRRNMAFNRKFITKHDNKKFKAR